MRALAATSLVGLALAAGCADKGTYVLLTLSNGPAQTVSISATLTLEGNPTPATVTYNAQGGTMFAFPRTASIEIGSGSGQLTVVADALDANNKVLGTAMGAVAITRGKTATLTLDLTGAPDHGDLGPSGTLAIAPMNYDFGSATANTMGAVKRFTVTNTGTIATGALQVLSDGMDATDYAIVQPVDCLGKMLDPNGTCTIDVQFFPKTPGAVKNAMLHALAPSGTPGGTATAQLLGKAVPKGNLSFNETMHVFPDTAIGSSSGDTTFTLKNTGLMASTTITVSLTGSDKGQFVIAMDNCTGSALSANGSCDVKVHAAPTARGAIAATLSADSAPNGPVPGDTAVVELSGKGLAQAQLTIINPYGVGTPFDLGTVDVGATGGSGMGNAYTFMIRNDGDLPTGQLTVGTNPTMADVTALMPGTTCMSANGMGGIGSVLNAGESCTAVIALKPTTFGKKDVTLTATATPGGAAATHVTGVGHDQVTINVVSTSANGAKGGIVDTAGPHNLNCDLNNTGMCSHVYDRTTAALPVTIQAMPDAGTYAQFDHWTITGPTALACTPTTTSPCSLTFDNAVAPGAYTITGTFKKQQFVVTYKRLDYDYGVGWSVGGLGGLSSTNGFSCPSGPCSTATDLVNGGTNLTVTAAASVVAAQGKSLRALTGPCTAGNQTSDDSTAATCTFTVTGDTTVTATFSAHPFAFVTQNTYAPNMGGIGGADGLCQTEATAAHLPGSFHAYLSTSAVDAGTRGWPAASWIRADGKPVFPSMSALTTQRAILYPLLLDASGGLRANDVNLSVWAATGQSGLHIAAGNTGTCTDWTMNSGGPNVSLGRIGSVAPEWLEWIGPACGGTAHIYCLGTSPINYTMTPLPTSAHRLAFLTSTTFTPGGGIGNADALCTAAKNTNASISGLTFKAFLAGDPTTTNLTAAERFNAGGQPWARLDGVELAPTGAALLNNPVNLEAALSVQQDGSYIGGYDRVWGGAPQPFAQPLGADACNNWNSMAANGEAGYSFRATPNFFFGDPGNLLPCNTPTKIYCLQQP